MPQVQLFHPVLGGIFLKTNHHTTPLSHSRHRLFQTNPTDLSVTEVCEKINQRFLQNHAELANYKLHGIKHFVIYLNGRVHLLKHAGTGHYEEIDKKDSPALMESFIVHKTLSHKITELAIICDALIQEDITWKVTYQYLDRLEEDLNTLSSILKKNEHPKNAEEIAAHKALITSSLNAIEQARSCKELKAIDRLCRHYLQEMQPLIKCYSKKSTQIQLEGMHKIMSFWSEHYELDLQNTRILVVGAKGPRVKRIEMQFFEDCYNKLGIADAPVYIETPIEIMPAMQSIDLIRNYGKYLINRSIGSLVLKNPEAMDKDILEEYAQEILKELPPLLHKTEKTSFAEERGSVFLSHSV